MPWHNEAMKDAATGDTPREGGSNLGSVDFRMGQPSSSNVGELSLESIERAEPTRGSETSQYPEEKKTIVIS